MIDFSTGDVVFDDGLRLSHETHAERIASLPAAHEIFAIKGRRNFALGPHVDSGQTWGVGAIFVDEKLSQIELQCATCIDNPNWLLEYEKRRQDYHNKYLESKIQECLSLSNIGFSLVATFSWGKISSELDAKGVQALLLISYNW